MNPILSLCLAVGLIPAVDDEQDAERAFLRQAMNALGEQAMAEPLVDVYDELHDRAWRLGEFDLARLAVGRITDWWELRDAEQPVDLSGSLLSLGQRIADRGDLVSALAIQRRALALREAALDPMHELVGRSLIQVSNVLQDMGDYPAARPLMERALEIFVAFRGPEHPDVAGTLNNLGKLAWDLGDYEGATAYLQRSLAIRESVYGPDSLITAESLGNVAVLYAEQDDEASARPYFERSLAIQVRRLGDQHPAVAHTRSNLGTTLNALGAYTEALQQFEGALDIYEAALGPDHVELFAPLHNMANLKTNLGDSEGARRHLERALRIGTAVYGAQHPDVATVRRTLVKTLMDVGDDDAAWALAQELGALQGQLRSTLASLTEGEGLLYLTKHQRNRDLLLGLGVPREADAAYGAVLEAKGQVARLTLQTRSRLRDTLDAHARQLSEALREAQSRLSQAALQTWVEDRRAHEQQLEALRAERDRLERELRRQVDVGSDHAISADDVAAALPPRSAVVDLLTHPVYEPSEFDDDGGLERVGDWSRDRIGAWIVRAGEGGVRHVDLGPLEPIERAVADFLADLASGAPGAAGDATLRRAVWDPLAPHLDDVDTVFLSPDGVLGTLPFGTLRDDDGRHLVEDRAFVYPIDVTALVTRDDTRRPLGGAGSRLLAVGGVDFRRDGVRGLGSSPDPDDLPRGSNVGGVLRGFVGRWAPLPATRTESESIVAMHAQASGDASDQLLLVGAEATEERLKREMPRHDLLHLATHGYFRPEGLPSLITAPVNGPDDGTRGRPLAAVGGRTPTVPAVPTTPDAPTDRISALHPGLLSGLVLAGVDAPGGASSDGDEGRHQDGYLTASEVTLLDLDDVELVVLSACETGLGRAAAGEGLLGLRRAFQLAGADTVVSSLWAVPDDSTRELMTRFYEHLLLDGMGRHDALRAAQLEMLERNRREHGETRPHSWGAFVLSGAWR